MTSPAHSIPSPAPGQVHAVGEDVHITLLEAGIINADLGVGHTTAEPRLGVGLALRLAVAPGWAAAHFSCGVDGSHGGAETGRPMVHGEPCCHAQPVAAPRLMETVILFHFVKQLEQRCFQGCCALLPTPRAEAALNWPQAL